MSESVRHVWPKSEDGTVKPSIYRVLPITRTEEAHGIPKWCENEGKVVLTVVEQ